MKGWLKKKANPSFLEGEASSIEKPMEKTRTGVTGDGPSFLFQKNVVAAQGEAC